MSQTQLVQQLKGGLDAPICLTWELTYACNLSCVHCLSSSGKRDPRELSTQQCKDIIDELRGLGCGIRVAIASHKQRSVAHAIAEVANVYLTLAADQDQADFYARLVRLYHDGKFARKLSGEGTLTLTTEPSGAQVRLHRLEEQAREVLGEGRLINLAAAEGHPAAGETACDALDLLEVGADDHAVLDREALVGEVVDGPLGIRVVVVHTQGLRELQAECGSGPRHAGLVAHDSILPAGVRRTREPLLAGALDGRTRSRQAGRTGRSVPRMTGTQTERLTSGLGAVAALMPEFEKRGTRVIGLSVDPVESHHQWEGDIADVTGSTYTYLINGHGPRLLAEACRRYGARSKP